jgi:hypothetical protein
MKINMVLAVFYIFILSACAVDMRTDVVTTVPFDEREAAFINIQGTNTIEGQAFMRQAGGGVVTCAGSEVSLIPKTEYATQRITQIYGSDIKGIINSLQGPRSLGSPAYMQMRRNTVCDAQGNFSFRNVADGTYYVTTLVLWTVGNSSIPQGGGVMQRVTVSGGQTQRLVISP